MSQLFDLLQAIQPYGDMTPTEFAVNYWQGLDDAGRMAVRAHDPDIWWEAQTCLAAIGLARPPRGCRPLSYAS